MSTWSAYRSCLEPTWRSSRRVLELLRGQGQEQVVVLVGGIIPDEDVPQLIELGVSATFGPGTSTDEIVRSIQEAVGHAAG